MSFQKLQVFGNVPLPRFGHSITPYAEGKICLFGGATGTTGQFSITDNTYTLDLATRFWKKVQTSGTSPSARAAHGAVCIEPYKIVIFGGATGSGGLASDDLYHLDIRDGVGVWNVINVSHKTPGKRYGHTFSYTKPYLIVFGGNIGEKSVNDCWILNIQKPPLVWTEIKCEGDVPSPRVYHSAALCQSGTAAGMVVIFGGRGLDNNPLGDSWGLRRHRRGHWDWVKAPQKTTPSPRYQHSSIFVGSLMLVIGGRTNNVSEQLPLEVFDTETSDWIGFNSLQRFRCGTWFHENFINIYGGFDLATPNVPTDSIYRINLMSLFGNNQHLRTKLLALNDKPPLDSSGSEDNTRPNSTDSKGPNTPVMRGGNSNRPITKEEPVRKEFFPKEEMKPKTQKKKRIKMLDPVMGNSTQVRPQYDIKRPLTSKADLPHYFLNELLQPKKFMNAEAIDIYFKPEHIHHLCNMAEEVIVNQPMILTPKTPLKIFGDIHGQFTDLMSFFELYGTPHQNGKKKDIENYDYVFLGDFVDRGSHSLETICLLLALKCVYPEQIHLIRGNHEDSQININFGFRDECADKISEEEPEDQNSVFNRINRLFDWLPLAATIQDRILCLHGGIGASLETLADIENIKRPLQVMHEVQDEESQVVLDILWSDPTESDSELGIIPNHLRDPSETGNIVKFGPDRVQQFLKKNNLSMIIRAHECVMDGFERFAGGSLITVFSATDYCRKHKNAGAILIVKTNYEIIPKLIYPSNTNANNWIEDEEQLKRRPPTPPRWRNQGR